MTDRLGKFQRPVQNNARRRNKRGDRGLAPAPSQHIAAYASCHWTHLGSWSTEAHRHGEGRNSFTSMLPRSAAARRIWQVDGSSSAHRSTGGREPVVGFDLLRRISATNAAFSGVLTRSVPPEAGPGIAKPFSKGVGPWGRGDDLSGMWQVCGCVTSSEKERVRCRPRAVTGARL